MKIQAGGGVQSLLVAEQSVSSTSDLPSRGEPFYRLTGTNPPMWLPLICASDTLFLHDLKLVCFIFFAQSNQQPLGTRRVYIDFFFSYFLFPHLHHPHRCGALGKGFRSRTQLYLTALSQNFSRTQFCASLLFFTLRPRVFRWAIENKQYSWHCNSISNNLRSNNEPERSRVGVGVCGGV